MSFYRYRYYTVCVRIISLRSACCWAPFCMSSSRLPVLAARTKLLPPTSFTADFAFQALHGSPSASTINQLETMHSQLEQHRTRFAVQHHELLVDGRAILPSPLLLLGIMSGNDARRRLHRCHWARVPATVLTRIHVRFVVGSAHALTAEWQHVPEAMELRVNISEGVRIWKRRPGDAQRKQAFTGTLSTYLKQAAFLRFAATYDAPLVGRADDDVFIAPRMLLAYATVLHHFPHAIYAGVFEWISWREARLEATGFSYGLPQARGRAKAPHRNCSRVPPDAKTDAYHHACIGPFGYAKGPLLMLNQRALNWLTRAPIFTRDLRRCQAMLDGHAATRKGRLDDDINLGFWMARMPELRVMRLRRVVWKDTWRDGADASTLLAAHKMPWALYDAMYNTTTAMWASAAAASVDAVCHADVPPCESCAHARSQRPCILEVSLEAPEVRAIECIQAPKPGMGCPNFQRESHPEAPPPGAPERCVPPFHGPGSIS